MASADIVVTAQKRSERLVDVPITVTAVTGSRLENAGISNVGALTQVVPAFRIDNTSTSAQPSIRGVGSSVSGSAAGSAVGIYVDGYYVPTAFTTDFDLLNVSSVQVLKGPQGTLFGRNTTGGAVLLTTSDPSTATQIRGRASYARFNALETAGYATTGLTDRIAVDLAGLYRRGDGFLHNIVTGSDKDGKYHSLSLRAGLKIEFNGSDSLLFRYSHSDSSDPRNAAQSLYKGQALGSVVPGIPIAMRRGEVSSTSENSFVTNIDAGYLTGRFDLGFADLVSYSMYRKEYVRLTQDLDGTALPVFTARFPTHDETITQEVNINSKPGGPLSWVAGAYFYHQKNRWPDFQIAFGGGPLTTIWRTRNTVTSYAAFADATYNVADKFFITAGARYSHEKDDAFYDLTVPDAATGQPVGFYPAKHSWQSFTPRAVLRYEISRASNVYASFTKGFKAGLLNPNGLTSTPISPEKITAFEVGYKISDGPTKFNISAFHYSYSDLQVVSYTGTVSIISNAAKSTIYGGEFDFTTRLGDHLTVSAGGAYTHAKYDQFVGAPRFDQFLADPTSPAYGIFISSPTDVSGNQLQRAPKLSGFVALDYSTEVANGTLALNANLAYQSKAWFDPAHQFVQNGYGLLSLRATWTEPSGHWSFGVFGNNVTDKTYTQSVFSTPFANLQTYGQPAVYGATASFKY